MVYCTLFNSNYLDKAKVMMDSLARVDKEMVIYILCMDITSLNILKKMNNEKYRLISLEEFEDTELLSVKDNRSPGEYCWTCTAKLIEYVLLKCNENICTYIDADLYFYNNPKVLIDEMKSAGCCVQIISHNFPRTLYGKIQEKVSGKNCVQFNTFTKNKKSLSLLRKWIYQCLDECSVNSSGDQMYISDWEKYSFVNISKHEGAGVAPWNIVKYRNIMVTKGLKIKNIENGKTDSIIFYHFQNVTNTNRYNVSIYPLLTYWILDKKLVKRLYYNYLFEIEMAKRFFEKNYDFLPLVSQYISDKKPNYLSYMVRFLNNPIVEFINFNHRVSCSILKRLRKKEGTVDVRKLVKRGIKYDNAE